MWPLVLITFLGWRRLSSPIFRPPPPLKCGSVTVSLDLVDLSLLEAPWTVPLLFLFSPSPLTLKHDRHTPTSPPSLTPRLSNYILSLQNSYKRGTIATPRSRTSFADFINFPPLYHFGRGLDPRPSVSSLRASPPFERPQYTSPLLLRKSSCYVEAFEIGFCSRCDLIET
jgi:hypothetical protein